MMIFIKKLWLLRLACILFIVVMCIKLIMYTLFVPNSESLELWQNVLNERHSKNNNAILDAKFARHFPPSQSSKRIAVITYLPEELNELYVFTTMLYGSWRYNILHKNNIYSPKETNTINIIDLVVVVHYNMESELPVGCERYAYSSQNNGDKMNRVGKTNVNYYVDNKTSIRSISENNGIKYNENQRNEKEKERDEEIIPFTFGPMCWKIIQRTKNKSKFKQLSSLLLFFKRNIYYILNRYDYIFYTTNDNFLTPSIFTINLNFKLAIGIRTLCDDFTRRRLKYIALKRNMTHNGVSCIGQSLFGRTRDVVAIMRKVGKLSQNIFKSEFKSSLLGLTNFDFKNDPDGESPRWYRLDSIKYSTELVLNHHVKGFSYDNMKRLDVSSCDHKPIIDQYSIKCYNIGCDFSKRRFISTLGEFQIGLPKRKTELKTKIYSYINQRNVYIRNMTVANYAGYIAWSSAGKYLKFVVKGLKMEYLKP